MYSIILKSGIIIDLKSQAIIDTVVSNMEQNKDTLIKSKSEKVVFYVKCEEVVAIQSK